MAGEYGQLRLLHMILLIMTMAVSINGEECTTPQYLEFGKSGTIHCTFDEGFYKLLWYNSPNTLGKLATLNYDSGGSKDGPGYLSGEFDIHPNGSLIINNVSLAHDTTFTVIKFADPTQNPVTYSIVVESIVKPQQHQPLVSQCEDDLNSCFIDWDDTDQISCKIKRSKPKVALVWESYPTNISREATSKTHISLNDNVTTSVEVILDTPFAFWQFVHLYVCKANDPLGFLDVDVTFVLVGNRKSDLPTMGSTTTSAQRGSETVLNCSDGDALFFIWRSDHSGTNLNTLAYGAPSEDSFENYVAHDMDLTGNNALVIKSTRVSDEGGYLCFYNDGNEEAAVLHDLTVYVIPTPAHPTFDGCNEQMSCAIDAGHEGNITCSVKGIRPAVSLEVEAINVDPSAISFNEKRETVLKADTFDVTLTIQYKIKQMDYQRLTWECRVTGQYSHLFPYTSTLDILIAQDRLLESNILSRSATMWLLVSAMLVLIIFVTCLAAFIVRRCRATDTMADEETPIIPSSLRDKRRAFIAQLQSTYETMYNSVRPIPHLKDIIYPVEEIFHNIDLDCLASKKTLKKKWYYVGSYQKIGKTRTNRYIIVGEPGYGKSTLTLQLCYEWCEGVPGSLFKEADVLILLRMRQLRGISELCDAIMWFLLPNDTSLNKEDVKRIIATSKLAIILDGYDEYPDRVSGCQSEIKDIITKSAFSQSVVMVTTRSSVLPEDLPPDTEHLRLRGFDKKVQEEYLYKLMGGHESSCMHSIMRLLGDNPVLGAICQVPLFFVLLAHLSKETDILDHLTSVTSFFIHVIGCFHGHLERKLEDKNVTKDNSYDDDHGQLDEVAFQSLIKGHTEYEWEREDLATKFGEEFLERYLRIGILHAENFTEINNLPGTSATERVQRKSTITFFHQLFCEWYAAHFLVEELYKNDKPLNVSLDDTQLDILDKVDPKQYPYVYRFACGIYGNAGKNIMQYLRSMDGGTHLAALCVLEFTDRMEDVIPELEDLCSEELQINSMKPEIQNRSTVHMAELASANEVSISCLSLQGHITVDHATNAILFQSNLRIPVLRKLQHLLIELESTGLDQKDLSGLFEYALESTDLTKLTFTQGVLPICLKEESTRKKLQAMGKTVRWNPSTTWYTLKWESGQWETSNGTILSDGQYNREVTTIRGMYSSV